MSRRAVVAGALALVLSGCSNGGDAKDGGGGADAPPAAAGGPSGGGSAAPKGPAYTGPRLPGLTAEQLWSVAAADDSGTEVDTATGTVTDGTATALVVGNAVVLLRTELAPNAPKAPPAADGKTVSGDWNTAQFRDAAAGSLRAAVNLRGRVATGSWAGRPVLYTVFTEATASDGLSAPKRTTVWLALDENGREIGRVALPDEGKAGVEQTVVDGWVVRTEQSGSTVKLTARPADGSSPGSTIEQKVGDFDGGKDRQIFGGLLFSHDKADKDDVEHLVATDLATGQRKWTTATVRKPAGAPEAATTSGHPPEIVRVVGDKVVIAWDAGAKSSFSFATVWGLYDLATGNLVYSGPRVDSGYYRTKVDRENALMVIASGTGGEVRSTAWDLKSGQTLWQQPKEGEKPIEPFVVVNGALYASTQGYSPSGGMSDERRATAPLVVDARTKAVILPEGVPGDLFPVLTTDGHGVVTTKDAVHVFGPAPRP